MKKDVLSVIEASYATSSDPDGWVRGVLDAIHPLLDRGLGVFAHRFSHEPAFSMGPLLGTGDVESMRRALEGLNQWMRETQPPERFAQFVRKAYPRAPTIGWLSEMLGHPWRSDFPVSGARDDGHGSYPQPPPLEMFGVVAGDLSGRGCVFYSFTPKMTPVSGRSRAMWQRVAAHVVAGHRLATQAQSPPDAVLEAGGKVVHRERGVTTDHSAWLSHATKAIDSARGRLRRTDTERAVAIWTALVAGRWSLVDQFDNDGRRYVVARRNRPGMRRWRTLTERESLVVASTAQGQSLKMIAYQLGVSMATVSAELKSAQAKVGVRGRLALVAAYRASHRGGGFS